MKTCSRCKKESKQVVNYSSHTNRDGTVRKYYHCRTCNNERARKYYNTESGRKAVRASIRRSIAKYPKKQEARIELNRQIRLGVIVRPSKCSRCHKTARIDGCHTDYSKPLKVIWLCRPCHYTVAKSK